ncbi:MAG: Rab family GTPase [Promethearchaeota archaeon]
MLRQLYIFRNGQQVFTHSFAIGLNQEEFENVKSILKSYIEMPMPGKTFQKPISNFQIFHRASGQNFFIYVTDLVDTLDYVDDIVKKTVKKFNELFEDPESIKENNKAKGQFIQYLYELQASMHSKIAIIGPVGAGKTTLYNMIKTDQEREIMNFAKSSRFKIGELTFDIWDFQLNDNFSLLWSKFVKGSDLCILVIDVSRYNLKLIDHFLKLQKIDGKFSRILILGNKIDLASELDIKKLKNELNLKDLREISLISPQAKAQVLTYIREALQMKKPLPPNFTHLIKEAEKLEEAKNLTAAISKYKELINICNQYQEFTFLETFETKLKRLEELRKEEIKRKKELELKKKFAAPKKIKFKQKIKVKALPTVKSLPKTAPITTRKPAVKNAQNSNFQKSANIGERTGLKLEKIEIKLPPLQSKKIKVKSEEIGGNLPTKNVNNIKKTSETILSNDGLDFAEILYKTIKDKGGDLSLALCQKYIKELLETLKRPLTKEDLEIAAKVYIQKERGY